MNVFLNVCELAIALIVTIEGFNIDVVNVQVGCDNIVNSGLQLDKCGVCGGNEETCEVTEEVFTNRTLRLGYNFVTRIPRGATRINITELSQSINHLALNSSNPKGSKYINGEWGTLDEPKIYRIPGTYVEYKRPKHTNRGESMTIPGPVIEDLDVWLFYQNENPGIFHSYTTPTPDISLFSTTPEVSTTQQAVKLQDLYLDVTSSRKKQAQKPIHTKLLPEKNHAWNHHIGSRRRVARDSIPRSEVTYMVPETEFEIDGVHDNLIPRTRFRWMYQGNSRCSKSCAEGRLTSLIRCVYRRKTTISVPDTFCSNLAKPPTMMRVCNRQACPAFYSVGRWFNCLKQCGIGKQHRRVHCRQKFSKNFTSAVSHKRCRKLRRPTTHQRCEIRKCQKWMITSDWSECNVHCGDGKRTRKVVCMSGNGTELPNMHCSESDTPPSEENCRMATCATAWFNTDWSNCTDCSSGLQKRDVICVNTTQSSPGCTPQTKPAVTRGCNTPRHDNKYTWFAGKWSTCTDACGSGTQNRRVMCAILSAGEDMRIVESHSSCNIKDKPTTQQTCNTQLCGPRWYFGTWRECSVTCGIGRRTRDVVCLYENEEHSSMCDADTKPIGIEKCNTKSCGNRPGHFCTNKPVKNCKTILRAGLCYYYRVKWYRACRLIRHQQMKAV